MSTLPPSQNGSMSSLYFDPYRDSEDMEDPKINLYSDNSGIIQFISVTCGIVLSFFPDEYDRAVHDWLPSANSATKKEGNTHWPTDISRDIIPVGCHSHNDYWRRVPLYSALQAGCTGVEADVWLFDDELYVGHTKSSLTERLTLRTMYIDPLVTILERQNPTTKFTTEPKTNPHGIFDTNPSQSLILLIDFKTAGPATYHAVTKHLAPLRDRGYLTHFNGDSLIQRPVTVVGTGNTPFNLITANATYRDIFFDAPLDKLLDANQADNPPPHPDADIQSPPPGTDTDLGQGHSGMPAVITPNTFNDTNSFYASVSFKKAIGYPWPFHFTQAQMERIRAQVRAAHRQGLKVRYWALPSWPRSLRNHVWRVLAQEGVDMLNVDDLVDATKGDWNSRVFDWWP
ncbi:uncharacterized protein N7515_009569 [Penicillium bovifimosum]|uniref:Altered inheritance of mitochondria protein 6 n=1 Tax=Penicillium bovifimosum TaxID=126998 RepID=A0A9W9GJJ5_9EURO|nr:uncharacterized protein N7515_009569 [Penicillium bovifimosum]KAJ5121608.1 hypothetical protein N7515_009569 [Penicillium bovifimosum]